ncbi:MULTISPECIES: hypothetical protein [unclassified Sporosarcina]|uniref:hypothetical protein n=1 Tax=unclassified Sporosarcina TaxID=2647733 RepID=UPI001A935355|nr:MULTISPECIES: hypothetical protein [unclassified Sporosarcina]MBO0588359.1 hypothetical protein [Sporosarcina sp. E16_8]MBO0603630.1 hypothetical protein [Sporosarcina sp. E16_3]
MDYNDFLRLEKEVEKEIILEDYLHEDYRFQTITSIYLIAFSLIYLIQNQELAIIIAFSIATTLLITTYIEMKKSERWFHKMIGTVSFGVIVAVLSFVIISVLSLFPTQANLTYAVVVCVSIMFGFLSAIRSFFVSLPYSKPNKILVIVSNKVYLFLVISITWIYILWANYDVNAIINAFNELKSNEEDIIGRISTSATVLPLGVFIMYNIKKKILNKKFNDTISFKKRIDSLMNRNK